MEYRERNPQSLRYRVLVYDDSRDVWTVKHSGLKKQDAQKYCKYYYNKGLDARIKAND